MGGGGGGVNLPFCSVRKKFSSAIWLLALFLLSDKSVFYEDTHTLYMDIWHSFLKKSIKCARVNPRPSPPPPLTEPLIRASAASQPFTTPINKHPGAPASAW